MTHPFNHPAPDCAIKVMLNAQSIAEIRHTRMWHWIQVLQNRGVDNNKADTHMLHVQALNSVFPAGDTADKDLNLVHVIRLLDYIEDASALGALGPDWKYVAQMAEKTGISGLSNYLKDTEKPDATKVREMIQQKVLQRV